MENFDVDPIAKMMTTVDSLAEGFFAHLPQMLAALVVLLVTLAISKISALIVRKLLQSARTRVALIRLGANLMSLVVWISGIAIATVVMFPSITPAKLIAGLGLTSVAIGFAFKDVIENFLAGVIILGRKKMRIGDVIECDNIFGKVEDIAIRETHVRDVDGELTIVPNAYLFKNPLKIQTDQDHKRQSLTVGVDYDTDMNSAREALTSALKSCSSVQKGHPISVECCAFGGSSIDFRLFWWAESTPRAQRQTYDEVAFAVKSALDDASITIPFPQITLSHRTENAPIKLNVKQSERFSENKGNYKLNTAS